MFPSELIAAITKLYSVRSETRFDAIFCTLAIWINFYCCKWPNIEQIIFPSFGNTEIKVLWYNIEKSLVKPYSAFFRSKSKKEGTYLMGGQLLTNISDFSHQSC